MDEPPYCRTMAISIHALLAEGDPWTKRPTTPR